jgi:hypothetical protein
MKWGKKLQELNSKGVWYNRGLIYQAQALRVKKKYDEAEKRVYINSTKYFDNVEPEVWNYQIGGYQVLHKYLKDRKGRNMDDPRHYCRVVSALSKTIEYQKKIDDIYEDVEKEIVEFI